MANISDLLPGVFAKARGVTDEEALYALKRAASDFYRLSYVARVPFEMDAQAGVVEYPLPDAPGPVLALRDVVIDGCPVTVVVRESVFVLPRAGNQDWVGGISGDVVYGFDEESCEIEDSLYQRIATGIMNGALAVLLGTENVDWYSRNGALAADRINKNEIARAKTTTTKQKTGGRTMMRAPLFVGRKYGR